MNANILDVEQGSAAWFSARCGCLTSSRIADALAKLKRKPGDESARRRKLRYELVCERLTGNPSDHYVTKWMEEGKENEPLARTAYELERDVTVEQIGYCYHPRIKMAGASPDGLVGNDGLVELKCPQTSTHLEYLLNGEIPEDYAFQMLWQMACLERAWCDFVSYDPRLPADLQVFAKRLLRDDAKIAEMEREAELFLGEVDVMLATIQDRNREFANSALVAQLSESRERLQR